MVQVDPTALTPGEHFAYIKAFDTTAVDAGMVWEVAITVIRTEQLKTAPRMHVIHSNVFQPGNKSRTLPLKKNSPFYTFFIPPAH